MFIQTEKTADAHTIRFLPGRAVLTAGTADFAERDAAAASPLARRLFAVEGVARVFLDPESIAVTKTDVKDWQVLKPAVLGAIMEHFASGEPVVAEQAAQQEAEDFLADAQADNELTRQIRELIDTRIKPAAAQDGGDVVYKGFKDGTVYLEMTGSGLALKDGIENMLKHYVAEVDRVADLRDAIPKPGMNTPEAAAIQQLLDESVNPAVAGHGGHISLVDVRGDTAYIRLEGGCQGCGMADVTLKQGVEVEIKRLVPSITAVLDVTDHAGGSNPYFQPGKGAMNPY